MEESTNIQQDNYYIAFAHNPVRFESINIEANVEIFFDDTNLPSFCSAWKRCSCNCQIMDDKKCGSFRIVDRGRLRSIKFSPDLKILAIQRAEKSVEL
jgi:hypothetical protein